MPLATTPVKYKPRPRRMTPPIVPPTRPERILGVATVICIVPDGYLRKFPRSLTHWNERRVEAEMLRLGESQPCKRPGGDVPSVEDRQVRSASLRVVQRAEQHAPRLPVRVGNDHRLGGGVNAWRRDPEVVRSFASIPIEVDDAVEELRPLPAAGGDAERPDFVDRAGEMARIDGGEIGGFFVRGGPLRDHDAGREVDLQAH